MVLRWWIRGLRAGPPTRPLARFRGLERSVFVRRGKLQRRLPKVPATARAEGLRPESRPSRAGRPCARLERRTGTPLRQDVTATRRFRERPPPPKLEQ